MKKISYAKTVYGQKEIDAVVKCLNESTQMGNYSRKFESKIADLFDKKSCLYVNSGSSALFIGIESFDFPEGSEVITPALTFGTTVGCLTKNKLVPVFVDVEPLSYCIDPNQIEEMITDKTVAILAPNLMGNICDWEKISNIAKQYNLVVIEDSADTLGGKLNNKSSGSYSDMSITSFYGSHIINCAGNGGALMLNNQKVIDKAKLLRSWGRSSSLFDEKSEEIENRFNIDIGGIDYDAKFVFEIAGYNLEGNELGAAFGLVQLESLNKNIEIREKNFNRQNKYFSKHNEFFSTPEQTKNTKTGWLAYPILINKNTNFKRKDFQIYLEKRDIQTRVVFTGNIIRQPMMKSVNYRVNKGGYPNSDAVMERGVLLPLHHGMTDEMFERLHSEIDNFLGQL
jgi:CDP-6-deoxy-D-xylo-4-hexulose-3-dehydrase